MIKKLFGYSMATWLGALISFILIPVASHLYSSNELGIINYYYSIINIIFTFILLGLDQAYLRYYVEYNDNQKKEQFTKNILFTIMVISVLAVLAMPFYRLLSVWLIDKELFSIIFIVYFHLMALVVTRYFVILFRLQSKLLEYTLFSVLNTIILKTVYLGGRLINANSITGIRFTACISIIIAIVLVIVYYSSFSFNNVFKIDDTLKNECKYAFPLVPAMVFAILNNSIPQIILRSKTDFSNVAIYSIGVTLASTITLLHNGLNTFLEPYIFKNYNTNKEQITKILDIFTIVANLLCMLVILFQNLFFFVFKKEYIVSTQFLPLLFCSSLWYTIGDFYNIGVKICKKTKENIVIYLLGFVTNTIISLLVVAEFGCIGAAVSAAIASALMAFLKIKKGNKYYDIMHDYKNIYLGAILLTAISIINIVFWKSYIKYVFVIMCICIYVIYSRVIDEIKILIKSHKKIVD